MRGWSTDRRRTDSNDYRPDIDGLRAVAVLSVLMFHLNIVPFSGGFVGVDIFFVISGYLITRAIYGELLRGEFSLSNFYARRIRRIFPALYLAIVLTIAAAMVILEPHEIRPLFDALRYPSVFLSNTYFMRAGGYFDAAVDTNPVLQTWSLSVEEQFYLGFPLVLMLALRFARPYLHGIILLIAIASLAAGAVRLSFDPQKAFFATEVRIFELMIGAVVGLGFKLQLERPATRAAVAMLGLAMMTGSMFVLSSETPFPGPNALPVCMGTALIIWAGERGCTTVVNRMLAWRPLVAIGLISYSVYLLHWPLVVFTKRVLLAELTPSQKATITVAALAGGYASWRFVEIPLRRAGITQRTAGVFATAAIMIAALGVGGIGAVRLILTPPSQVVADAEHSRSAAAADPCLLHISMPPVMWRAETCIRGDKGKLIAVWGDSYAGHYFDAFRDLGARSGLRIALFGSAACPPAAGLEIRERPQCRAFNAMVMERLDAMKPDVVVLSAHWLNYEKRRSLLGNDVMHYVRETVVGLRRTGAKVLVIGPSPIFPSSVPLIALAKSGPAKAGLYYARYSKLFDELFRNLQAQGQLSYFSTYKVFCSNNDLCRFREQDTYFFWDNGHMTHGGADRVINRLAAELPPTVLSALSK